MSVELPKNAQMATLTPDHKARPCSPSLTPTRFGHDRLLLSELCEHSYLFCERSMCLVVSCGDCWGYSYVIWYL